MPERMIIEKYSKKIHGLWFNAHNVTNVLYFVKNSSSKIEDAEQFLVI